MRPCLLSSHRTSVLLIGVEGFPHSSFRHFIRYVNIRGITPEEQGEQSRQRMRRELGEGEGFREQILVSSAQDALENRPPQ